MRRQGSDVYVRAFGAPIFSPERTVTQVVVAFLVGTAAEADLDAHLLERIARFKRPKRYLFVDELPKNSYGKVLKRELRDRLS